MSQLETRVGEFFSFKDPIRGSVVHRGMVKQLDIPILSQTITLPTIVKIPSVDSAEYSLGTVLEIKFLDETEEIIRLDSEVTRDPLLPTRSFLFTVLEK